MSSVILEIEISRNPDAGRRHDVLRLLAYADETLVPGQEDAERARTLEQFGFKAFDALHVACAEHGNVDVLLTTDDDLIRRARRYRSLLLIRVEPAILVSGVLSMMSPDEMTDEQFERHAFAILQRELGVGGLARFLRIYRSGSGDYTRERHRWLNGATVDEVMTELERRTDRSA